ncbi:MAG: hypothetical protein ACC653_04905 [Gammaproteobacteria bacterium]
MINLRIFKPTSIVSIICASALFTHTTILLAEPVPATVESIELSPVQATPAAKQSAKSPWFYGGGLAISFGDVEYYEISPMIGYNLNPKTAVGVSFLYRYRKDERYSQSYSTTDYGATLFGRYNLTPSFYLQAEYEYIDYEFAILSGVNVARTERDTFGSLLAGAGIQKSLGGNASLYFTALYNFNYDDPDSPYTEPVTIRFGIGVGF